MVVQCLLMAFREELQKRIDRKRAEIHALEGKLKEAEIYVQALEDTLKMLPHDGDDATEVSTETLLREGSNIARAREVLQNAGRPLHILEMLSAMGKPTDKDNRAALAGSLGAYVRRGEIFTRPAPNTFGLTGMKLSGLQPSVSAPPANFGIDAPEGDPPQEEGLPVLDPDVPF
jgi:hypothetical protein